MEQIKSVFWVELLTCSQLVDERTLFSQMGPVMMRSLPRHVCTYYVVSTAHPVGCLRDHLRRQ